MKVLLAIMHKTLNIKIMLAALLFSFSFNALGDTSTFTQTDSVPFAPSAFSIKVDGNSYLLSWDGSGASYYKLEHLVDDNWLLINNNILTNTYTVPFSSGNELRVSSCNSYGCSNWRNVNNIVTGDLMINRFSKSADAVVVGQDVLLSWEVYSASHIEISSNKGHLYSTHINRGTQAFTVNQLTQFTLTATSFGQTHEQKIMVSPVSAVTDFSSKTNLDNYDLPLQNYLLAKNKEMLPIERALFSVALSSGAKLNIIPQHNNKLSRVSDDGTELWTIDLDGMVANRPVFKATETQGINYVFFNVSSVQGYGQLCRITIDEADSSADNLDVQCLTKQPNSEQPLFSMVASPLLVDDRVLAFSVNGQLYEVSTEFTNESYRQHGQISLDTDDAILTTPVVDMRTNSIIIRTKNNDVMSIIIPAVHKAVNQMVKRTKAFFGVVSAFSTSSITSILAITSLSSGSVNEKIVIKWRKSLSQEEVK